MEVPMPPTSALRACLGGAAEAVAARMRAGHAPPKARADAKRVRALYEDAALVGFDVEDVERALMALARADAPLTRAALFDVLVLTVERLPPVMRGNAAVAPSAADAAGPAAVSFAAGDAPRARASVDDREEVANLHAETAAHMEAVHARAEADARAAKDFIRNMTWSDSEEEDSGGESDAPRSPWDALYGAEVDTAAWLERAGAREEHRAQLRTSPGARDAEAAETTFGAIPGPPWRRALTYEYARARRTAATAKRGGNGAVAAAAGKIIGVCKREARDSGVDAAALDALADALAKVWDGEGTGAPWEQNERATEPPRTSAEDDADPNAAAADDDDDDAPPSMLDEMFDAMADDASSAPATSDWRPPPRPESGTAALLAASALLQSVCPRVKAKPPRFDQLKGGGIAARLGIAGTGAPRRRGGAAAGMRSYEATKEECAALHSGATPRELASVRALVGLLEATGDGALALDAPGVSAEAVALERAQCYHSLKEDWAREAWRLACGAVDGDASSGARGNEDARRASFVEAVLAARDGGAPRSTQPKLDAAEGRGSSRTASASAERTRQDWVDPARLAPPPPALATNPVLPAHAQREAVSAAAHTGCRCAVITGETGSGKSTQVPQFVLDAHPESARVLVCQPRRVAAMSLAARVAAERGEKSPGGVSGYHVRGSRAASPSTRMLFVTCGMALRILRDGGDAAFSHVVVDEVHERSIETDLLLALLKGMRHRREASQRPLGVLLMSATCDVALWRGFLGVGAQHVHIEGRTYPVIIKHLDDLLSRRALASLAGKAGLGGEGEEEDEEEEEEEEDEEDDDEGGRGDEEDEPSWEGEAAPAAGDTANAPPPPELEEGGVAYQPPPDAGEEEVCTSPDLLCAAVEAADDALARQEAGGSAAGAPRGSILVFLPSIAQCEGLAEVLRGSRRFGSGEQGDWVVALHSRSDAEAQRRAFAAVPSSIAARKVVVATNVAEASVTIADVACVVDTGREKRVVHRRRRGTSQLCERWVSRQSAKQRAGRAGRTRPGLCLRLYTRRRHDRGMASSRAPELRVARLDRALMECLAYAPTARELAALVRALPEPPEPSKVVDAWEELREIGAVEGAMDASVQGEAASPGGLTALGRVLCELPCAPAVGKMVVLAAFFGCLPPALSIAAGLSTEAGDRVLGGRGPAGPSWLQRCAAPLPSSADARANDPRVALFGERAVAWAAGSGSDLLCLASLWEMQHRRGTSKAAQAYVASSGATASQMREWREMRAQLEESVCDAPWARRRRGLRGEPRDRWLVEAIAAGCLHGAVASRAGRSGWTDGKGPVAIAASSAASATDAALVCHARKDAVPARRPGQAPVARASGVGRARPLALSLLGGGFGAGGAAVEDVVGGVLGAPPAAVRCGPGGGVRVPYASPAAARACGWLRLAADKELAEELRGEGGGEDDGWRGGIAALVDALAASHDV